MSKEPRTPSLRCLDIYRLAVARHIKKQDIAASYGVTPSRISHVLRRVEAWVNSSVGDWLFPHRHDFRFYAALAVEKIQLCESPHDPEEVVIEGHGWRYVRTNRPAEVTPQLDNPADLSADTSTTPQLGPHFAPHLTAHPVNSTAQAANDASALTPDTPIDSTSPATLELAHRLAHLLTLWRKSKKHEPHKAATIGRGQST
jgi:hypothetical protein